MTTITDNNLLVQQCYPDEPPELPEAAYYDPAEDGDADPIDADAAGASGAMDRLEAGRRF